jgi:glycosyltransferase involved in cell wall biosynthesis
VTGGRALGAAAERWPSVDVVIPTRNRPEFVRVAIDSVRAQDYAGPLRVYVVFDGEEPDEGLVDDGPVPVHVLRNNRTPGLCGTRNTGILAGSGELVAFLDDDDRWLPGKLRRQVTLLGSRPDAEFASTSSCIEFAERRTDRYAGTDTVTHERLLESRMSMLHSSTFVLRRSALVGDGGLVDENAPQGQNEDWDLLLRYSARHPIAHVDEPLVAIRWGTTSLFARAWEGKIDGARWILERHPDIATSRTGHARVLAQIAFAEAALGKRRPAVRTAAAAMRVRGREPRAYLAVLAAAGVPASTILGVLHRWGRGV